MMRSARRRKLLERHPPIARPAPLAFARRRRYFHSPSDSEDGLHRFPDDREAVAGLCLARHVCEGATVAKTSPIEFIRQVQAETRKVVWPSRRETVMTAVMVLIMTTILALFFLGVDTVFDQVVKGLLHLAK